MSHMTLVTGAGGHVGAAVVRELLTQGRSVRAMFLPGESRRSVDGLPVEIVEASITDTAALDKAVNGCEVVYHFAAYISLLATQKEKSKLNDINVIGTKNVIDACLKHHVRRLVHCSSSEVLVDRPMDIPVDEQRPYVTEGHPMPYAVTKARGEMLVKEAVAKRGLDAVIPISDRVIGPYNFGLSLTTSMIVKWVKGDNAPILQGGYNWIDARDLAHGAYLAEMKGTKGEGYLFSVGWHSIEEMGTIVTQYAETGTFKKRISINTLKLIAPINEFLHVYFGVPLQAARAQVVPLTANPHFNVEKAQQQLGWQPRPFTQTLKDIVDWLKAERFV